MSSRCKSCGKNIKWIETLSGKRMPVNIEIIAVTPTSDGDTTIITDKGVIVKGKREELKALAEGIAVAGYISHFATCQYAKQHRRKKD
jgi:recombinational DNA repair protein RecR